MSEPVRIDKFLWCVRIYKTRMLATEGCNGGKIKLNGLAVKPSKSIHINDIISIKKGVITYQYQVLAIPNNRISAKDVHTFLKNITPETELLKINDLSYRPVIKRPRGTGRPTKKERRDIDKWRE